MASTVASPADVQAGIRVADITQCQLAEECPIRPQHLTHATTQLQQRVTIDTQCRVVPDVTCVIHTFQPLYTHTTLLCHRTLH